LEDARHRIGLSQYNLLTVKLIKIVACTVRYGTFTLPNVAMGHALNATDIFHGNSPFISRRYRVFLSCENLFGWCVSLDRARTSWSSSSSFSSASVFPGFTTGPCHTHTVFTIAGDVSSLVEIQGTQSKRASLEDVCLDFLMVKKQRFIKSNRTHTCSHPPILSSSSFVFFFSSASFYPSFLCFCIPPAYLFIPPPAAFLSLHPLILYPSSL
jgi:hypothetical protein